MARSEVVLGWCAEPVGVQFPELPEREAQHFTKDSQDISRLRVRGLLSRSEADKAYDRLAKEVRKAVASASGSQEESV